MIFKQILSKNRRSGYDRFMSNVETTALVRAKSQRRSPFRELFTWSRGLIAPVSRAEKLFCPGGHDNPLKRLISNKGIQGNPSFFPLEKFGLAWPGLVWL